MATNNVDVDMIVQSVRVANEGVTDITFTIARSDLASAEATLDQLKKEMDIEDILVDDHMAKYPSSVLVWPVILVLHRGCSVFSAS